MFHKMEVKPVNLHNFTKNHGFDNCTAKVEGYFITQGGKPLPFGGKPLPHCKIEKYSGFEYVFLPSKINDCLKKYENEQKKN
jgi:hypothetical protein